MTARVDGLLEARHGVLKIPLSAVFEEGGKEIAYSGAAADKDKPRKIALKLGLRNETDAEVLEGPKPGEKLLTEKPVDKPAS
jgi:multidrug efflux pump subunit AcrA (membrane-fusion protein)